MTIYEYGILLGHQEMYDLGLRTGREVGFDIGTDSYKT